MLLPIGGGKLGKAWAMAIMVVASSGAEVASLVVEVEKALIERSLKSQAVDDRRPLLGALACVLKRHKCLGSPNRGSTVVLAIGNPTNWPRSDSTIGEALSKHLSASQSWCHCC